MQWAIITWGLVIGVAGLIWIMVLAVKQDRQDRHPAAEGDPAPSAGFTPGLQKADHDDQRCTQSNAA